jgi:rSAM/selenodomain-associated transferase 1
MPTHSTRVAPPPLAALVVFLKSPSRSKRRLAAAIGPECATVAASHLLACALEDAAGWPGPVVLSPADPCDAEWLEQSATALHERIVQRGANLGSRINYVDTELRNRGYEHLIFIGSDCPALAASDLADAAAALANADAVIAPARDGGVVLMGARRPWPALDDLPWSTTGLRAALEQRLRHCDWHIQALPTFADVDTIEDLDRAAEHIADDPRPARRALYRWRVSLRAGTDIE